MSCRFEKLRRFLLSQPRLLHSLTALLAGHMNLTDPFGQYRSSLINALLLYIEFLFVLLIMISSIIIIAHAVQPSIDKHPGKVSHQTNMGRLKMQDQKMEDQKR